MKYILIPLIAFTFAAGESPAQNTMENRQISYPYFATSERSDQIKKYYKIIQIGMTPQEIKSLLGEPDETHPLYEAQILNAKQIGYTQWFLVQRRTDKGSAKDKDEKLVRVSYDLNWKVLGVDHWGFDDKNR